MKITIFLFFRQNLCSAWPGGVRWGRMGLGELGGVSGESPCQVASMVMVSAPAFVQGASSRQKPYSISFVV